MRRQIGDLKVKRALADLENMTADMVGELGSANDSFNRLQEMVEEERDKASARARVAGATFDASDLALKEAEQEALADQALEEFLTDESGSDAGAPLPLPDFSDKRQTVSAPKTRPDSDDQ